MNTGKDWCEMSIIVEDVATFLNVSIIFLFTDNRTFLYLYNFFILNIFLHPERLDHNED